MKAIIEIDVPEWQIGEEVRIYFPDSMCVTGVCKTTDCIEIEKERCKK